MGKRTIIEEEWRMEVMGEFTDQHRDTAIGMMGSPFPQLTGQHFELMGKMLDQAAERQQIAFQAAQKQLTGKKR